MDKVTPGAGAREDSSINLLELVDQQIITHEVIDRQQTYLQTALDWIFRRDEDAVANLKDLREEISANGGIVDRKVLAERLQASHDAEQSQFNVSRYGAGALKTAALFLPGGAGLAATIALNALDHARPADSAKHQMMDAGLGAMQGGILRLTLGALPAGHFAARGALIGVTSRLSDRLFDRHNYVTGGSTDIAGGVRRAVSDATQPAMLLSDVITFGGAHFLGGMVHTVVPRITPFWSTVATGATFGFSSGMTTEFTRQRMMNEKFHLGRMMLSGAMSAAIDGVAAAPGAYVTQQQMIRSGQWDPVMEAHRVKEFAREREEQNHEHRTNVAFWQSFPRLIPLMFGGAFAVDAIEAKFDGTVSQKAGERLVESMAHSPRQGHAAAEHPDQTAKPITVDIEELRSSAATYGERIDPQDISKVVAQQTQKSVVVEMSDGSLRQMEKVGHAWTALPYSVPMETGEPLQAEFAGGVKVTAQRGGQGQGSEGDPLRTDASIRWSDGRQFRLWSRDGEKGAIDYFAELVDRTGSATRQYVGTYEGKTILRGKDQSLQIKISPRFWGNSEQAALQSGVRGADGSLITLSRRSAANPGDIVWTAEILRPDGTRLIDSFKTPQFREVNESQPGPRNYTAPNPILASTAIGPDTVDLGNGIRQINHKDGVSTVFRSGDVFSSLKDGTKALQTQEGLQITEFPDGASVVRSAAGEHVTLGALDTIPLPPEILTPGVPIRSGVIKPGNTGFEQSNTIDRLQVGSGF